MEIDQTKISMCDHLRECECKIELSRKKRLIQGIISWLLTLLWYGLLLQLTIL